METEQRQSVEPGKFNLQATVWSATIEDKDEHADYVHKWSAVRNQDFIGFENQYRVSPDGLIPDEGALYQTNKAEADRIEKFWRRHVKAIAISNGIGSVSEREITPELADRIKQKRFRHMELSVAGVTMATARRPAKADEETAGAWMDNDDDRSLRIPVEYLGYEVFLTIKEPNYQDRERWKELTSLSRKRNTFKYDAQSQYDFAKKFVLAADGFSLGANQEPNLSEIVGLIPWPVLKAAMNAAFTAYEGALKN